MSLIQRCPIRGVPLHYVMRLVLPYRRNAGVVGQHEPTDSVSGLAVGRLAGEGNLETRGETHTI